MGDSWTTVCQKLVPQVLQERDWQLIEDLPAFVVQVKQAIAQGVVRTRRGASREATARRATIHLYCRELYKACGEHSTLRQHRAFEETGRHAQGVAFRYERDLDVIQICVQHTLAILWEKREQIRDPGSLLRWVEVVVRRKILVCQSSGKKRSDIPISQLLPKGETGNSDDENIQHFWETLTSIPPPDDEIVHKELSEQLWHEVGRAMSAYPREEAVIVGCFRDGLSASDLAETLQTAVSNIYVIKCRALKRLRNDESFVQRFADVLETLSDRPGGKR